MFLVLRIVCYLALALIVGSFAALMVTGTFGGCTQSGDLVDCSSPPLQSLANGANIVLLTSVFTGVPVLLALGGIFFLIRALVRSRRARAGARS